MTPETLRTVLHARYITPDLTSGTGGIYLWFNERFGVLNRAWSRVWRLIPVYQ